MKKVLVIHYSQTGQLKEIADSVVQPLEEDEEISVQHERIEPKEDFPFPWKAIDFFDAFPESVQEIPCELKPFSFDPEARFDLIVLCYQPWFLSPSIPITSFLKSEEARKVMKDTPVITLSGSRNMWVVAQEKVKRMIHANEGRLLGNIAMVDPHSNLVSLVSILGWMLKGKREGLMGVFPRSGVPRKDLSDADKFGIPIRDALERDFRDFDQEQLREKGAVRVRPNLMVLEKRGARAFKAFSGFIRKKGPPGHPSRKARLRLFAACLFPGIIILSPITTLSTYLILFLRRKKIQRDVAYHEGVRFEEGKG